MVDTKEDSGGVGIGYGHTTVGTEDVNIRFFDGEKSLPIPYAFTIGAVTFVGTLYLKDPLENSYTDGVWAGAVNGTFHLDKNSAEACATGVVKVCIKIDFGARALYAQLCTPRIWPPGWDCGGWKKIIGW